MQINIKPIIYQKLLAYKKAIIKIVDIEPSFSSIIDDLLIRYIESVENKKEKNIESVFDSDKIKKSIINVYKELIKNE